MDSPFPTLISIIAAVDWRCPDYRGRGFKQRQLQCRYLRHFQQGNIFLVTIWAFSAILMIMENEYVNFGLPNAPVTAIQTPEPRQRGWLSRNLWWLLPTAFLVVALPIGCCAGIFAWVVGSLTSSEPYQMTVKRVCADRQVIEKLGEPVQETSWMPMGNFSYHINNGVKSGEATFSFSVSGPKDSASVHVEAVCRENKWIWKVLDVTPSDGQVISLPVGEKPIDVRKL
jgi:hypothetical protein